eukprot:jgi/Bigna1/80454/fgenesh1_pg.71_\
MVANPCSLLFMITIAVVGSSPSTPSPTPWSPLCSTSCIQEKPCLMELWNSTNGPQWTTAATNNWDVGCPCSGQYSAAWQGIACNFHCQVEELNVQNWGLEGHLPACLFSLQMPALIRYNMWENRISGTLPVPSGRNSTLIISLRDNKLSGTIPEGYFAPLGSQAAVSFTSNSFSGTLPEVLNAEVDELIDLELSSNRISGSIPQWLMESPPFGLTIRHNRCRSQLYYNSMDEVLIFPIGVGHHQVIRHLSKHFFPGVIPSLQYQLRKQHNIGQHPFLPCKRNEHSFLKRQQSRRVSSILLSIFKDSAAQLAKQPRDIRTASNLHLPDETDVSITCKLKFGGDDPELLCHHANSDGTKHPKLQLENSLSGYIPESIPFNYDLSSNLLSASRSNETLVELWDIFLQEVALLQASRHQHYAVIQQYLHPQIESPVTCPNAVTVTAYPFFDSQPEQNQRNIASLVQHHFKRLERRHIPELPFRDRKFILCEYWICGRPQQSVLRHDSPTLQKHQFPLFKITPGVSEPVLLGLLLDNNKLSGDVSALKNYPRLQFLRMSNNSVEGTLGKWIGKLAFLQAFTIDSNKISGTLPEAFQNLTALSELQLANNLISGSLPTLPRNKLETLTLHKNKISGTADTLLQNLTSLRVLTMHDNSIQGHFLWLTGSGDNMCEGTLPERMESSEADNLILHNNRISCKIPDLPQGATATGTVLMGNLMTASRDSIPSWVLASTRDNTLLYSDGQEGRRLIEITLFTFFLFVINAVLMWFLGRFNIRHIIQIKALGLTHNARDFLRAFQIAILCIAVCCFVALVSLVPIFEKGAKYYDCINDLTKSSLAYLDSEEAEKAAIGCLVVYALSAIGCTAIFHLRMIRTHDNSKRRALHNRNVRRIAHEVLAVETTGIPSHYATEMVASYRKQIEGHEGDNKKVASTAAQENQQGTPPRSPASPDMQRIGRRNHHHEDNAEHDITGSVRSRSHSPPRTPRQQRRLDHLSHANISFAKNMPRSTQDARDGISGSRSTPREASPSSYSQAEFGTDNMPLPAVGNLKDEKQLGKMIGQKKNRTKHWCTKLTWFLLVPLWICVCTTLSVPSIIYTISAALPSENSLGIRLRNNFEVTAVVMASVFTNAFLIPKAGRTFAEATGYAEESSRLLVIYQITSTLLPVIILLILDQGCFQYYLTVWDACLNSSMFTIQRLINLDSLKQAIGAPSTIDFGSFYSTFLTQEDVCTPVYRQGFCSRRIVHVFGDFITIKWALRAFGRPGTVLFAKQVSHVVLTGCGVAMERTVDFDVEYAEMAGSLIELMVFGSIIPIVLVFGLIAFISDYYVMVQLFATGMYTNVKGSDAEEDLRLIRLPKMQLHITSVLLTVLLGWFFFENDLSNWPALVGVLSAILCLDWVVAILCNRHGSRLEKRLEIKSLKKAARGVELKEMKAEAGEVQRHVERIKKMHTETVVRQSRSNMALGISKNIMSIMRINTQHRSRNDNNSPATSGHGIQRENVVGASQPRMSFRARSAFPNSRAQIPKLATNNAAVPPSSRASVSGAPGHNLPRGRLGSINRGGNKMFRRTSAIQRKGALGRIARVQNVVAGGDLASSRQNTPALETTGTTPNVRVASGTSQVDSKVGGTSVVPQKRSHGKQHAIDPSEAKATNSGNPEGNDTHAISDVQVTMKGAAD